MAHGSAWFGVYVDPKDLEGCGTEKLRSQIASGESGKAWRLIEAELERMVAQGRTVNKGLIDRIVGHTLGAFDASITEPIADALYNDFEVGKRTK